MGTNPKSDKLSDITEHGLTSSGLPSTSLREVRRARESEECRREDTKPQVQPWPPSRAEQVAMSVRYRQDEHGNKRKSEPDR